MNNPLLQPYKTPYEAVPFSEITPKHFIPALIEGIKTALKEVDELVKQEERPTFENTLQKLDNCGTLVSNISSVLFNLNSAETSTEIQQIAQEAAPLLTQFQNDIRLNEALFDRIKTVHETVKRDGLNPEQKTLLEKEYKSFVRNGALLSDEEKEKLREIDTALAQLSLQFGQNVLADTQAFSLHLTQKEDLNGLPENVIETAAHLAEQKNLTGWLFTLDYPSYVPFMTYAENRGLRKKMAIAFGQRGFQDNPQNNIENIKKIIRLRKERATLLGYTSHAAFVLEERMAQSEEEVSKFLEQLYQKALPAAQKEWEALKDFGTQLGIDTLEKWDTAFVGEKLKQHLFKLDEQLLKPYLPLDRVMEGLFVIAHKLFGLSFKANPKIPGYHKEVSVYEVNQKASGFCALLYVDLFPRTGKRSGAWMTSYRPQKKEQRPHVSIVCNFSRPTKTKPSLLTFQEVTTLFHEFGHALHGMLARTTFSSLSGTNVYWDFVELPSQIMENWCYQPEALALFTKHFETEETLPIDYVNKIKKAAQFQQGLQTLRQLGFGFLDLSYHGKESASIENIKDHEHTILKKVQFTKDTPENCSSTAFSHIFQGGYAAGYYSYKWAEVLDADAFELFLEKGIFDQETAQNFEEHILSKGGTEHPMTLYERFRGKAPDPQALLRRAGLV